MKVGYPLLKGNSNTICLEGMCSLGTGATYEFYSILSTAVSGKIIMFLLKAFQEFLAFGYLHDF